MLVYMHLSDTDESSVLSFIFLLISCLSHDVPSLFLSLPPFLYFLHSLYFLFLSSLYRPETGPEQAESQRQ